MFLKGIALPDVALGMLCQDAVHIIVGIEHVAEIGARVAVIFIERSQAMVLVKHIVHLQLWRPALPDVFAFLSCRALNVVGTNVVDKLVVLQLLDVSVASCPERGSEVEATRAVVHVEVVGNGVSILIHSVQVVLETESLALCLLELDAHNGLGRCGIACTGVLDHINVLNLVGTQARELAHVLNLAAVDIHLGIATAKHLHAAVALSFERWHSR